MIKENIFDTHSLFKRFMVSGFNEKQSEMIVTAIAEMQSFDTSHLSTKSDLAQTEKLLRADLVQTESLLRADLAQTEKDIRSDLAQTEKDIRADINLLDVNLRAEMQKSEAATKAEIQRSEAATRADLRAEIAENRSLIEKSKNEILKWFIGVSFGGVFGIASVIITIIKFSK